MHIQTNRHTARYRHRLYVVLPLFLVLGWVGVGGHTDASVVSVENLHQSGSVTMVGYDRLVIDGAAVAVSGEKEVEVWGSALIGGKSFIAVQAGEFLLEGWNGVFGIDVSAATLTVASITTPVLVHRNGASWLVPTGMQMTVAAADKTSPKVFADWVKMRRPLPLPAHYLRERLPEADRLMALVSVQSLPIQESRSSPVLSALSDALRQSDTTQSDALFADARTRIALESADPEELWNMLSLGLKQHRYLQLLPALLHHPESFLIARFHPLLRDYALVYADGVGDTDLLLLGQMLLPRSDHRDTAVSTIIVKEWASGWQLLAARGALSTDMLDVILPLLVQDMTQLDTAGYPARARAYSAALVSGLQSLSEGLSGSALEAFDELRTLYDIPLAVVSSSADVPVEIPVTEPSVDVPADAAVIVVAESDVRSILSAEGCMFTTQSTLRLRENGVYEIGNVVLGTPTGDRVISFSFDPSAGLVSGIEKDGQILPYSLTLEMYLEWVRSNF